MAKVHGDLGDSVFVKQYGYYRTGTNLVESLLPLNFNCVVLRNQLGGKHESPGDWAELLRKQPSPDLPELSAAVAANAVRLIVNIKDPYAWLASFVRFWRWKVSEGLAKRKLGGIFLAEKCREYSNRCVRWAAFAREKDGHILQFEKLLADHDGTVRRIGKALRLQSLTDAVVRIEDRVDPHAILRRQPFDPTYYTERRYLAELTKTHKHIMRDSADWPFFRAFGYKY